MISFIAALSKETRVIGKEGGLIWDLPEDMQRFRTLTKGHPVIMGRKTWESLPEKHRPLPGRVNVVITRDTSYVAPGAQVVHTADDALNIAKESEGADEIFVIGGGQIYTEMLPKADRLYLTLVEDEAEGDAVFPKYPEFTKVVEERKNEENGLSYTFLTLDRG